MYLSQSFSPVVRGRPLVACSVLHVNNRLFAVMLAQSATQYSKPTNTKVLFEIIMDNWLKTGSLKRKSEETSDTTGKVQQLDANASSILSSIAVESQEDHGLSSGTCSKSTPAQTRQKIHCRDELKRLMMKETSEFFAPGENAKATEASCEVSLLIAKAGKPHSIGETLIKPAAKVMANKIFGDKASNDIDRIPLSNDTVPWRIKLMAESVEDQLMTRLRQTRFSSLQLDESTDIGNEANLLSYVRYIYDGGVHDEFFFCQSLPTNTTGEAIFHSLNDCFVKNNLDWSRCVRICTDGATAMTGKQKGLVACVRAVAPSAAATHCCIHREQLAVKTMLRCLRSVLDESVKIVNKIKGRPLNTRLFQVLMKWEVSTQISL